MTWTILRTDGPNHLGLRCNAFPGHQMALVTSGCAPFRCATCDADPTNDCVADCGGVWGGPATLDRCGVCGGIPPPRNSAHTKHPG